MIGTAFKDKSIRYLSLKTIQLPFNANHLSSKTNGAFLDEWLFIEL